MGCILTTALLCIIFYIKWSANLLCHMWISSNVFNSSLYFIEGKTQSDEEANFSVVKGHNFHATSNHFLYQLVLMSPQHHGQSGLCYVLHDVITIEGQIMLWLTVTYKNWTRLLHSCRLSIKPPQQQTWSITFGGKRLFYDQYRICKNSWKISLCQSKLHMWFHQWHLFHSWFLILTWTQQPCHKNFFYSVVISSMMMIIISGSVTTNGSRLSVAKKYTLHIDSKKVVKHVLYISKIKKIFCLKADLPFQDIMVYLRLLHVFF